MSLESSPPIPSDRSSPEPQQPPQNDDVGTTTSAPAPTPPLSRSNRPSRACTIRAAARLQQQYQQQHQHAEPRKPKAAKKDQQQRDDDESSPQQCGSASKIVTSLVDPPSPSQLPRWTLRSMWELASVLNFLHVSSQSFDFCFLGFLDVLGLMHLLCSISGVSAAFEYTSRVLG